MALLSIALLALCAHLYIHTFGMNVPFANSFNGRQSNLKAQVTARLTLQDLWLAHHEDHMLFPNLIHVLPESRTRLSSPLDMSFGTAFLTLSAAVMVDLVRLKTGSPTWGFVPVPLLMLSLIQRKDLLGVSLPAQPLVSILGVDKQGALRRSRDMM